MRMEATGGEPADGGHAGRRILMRIRKQCQSPSDLHEVFADVVAYASGCVGGGLPELPCVPAPWAPPCLDGRLRGESVREAAALMGAFCRRAQCLATSACHVVVDGVSTAPLLPMRLEKYWADVLRAVVRHIASSEGALLVVEAGSGVLSKCLSSPSGVAGAAQYGYGEVEAYATAVGRRAVAKLRELLGSAALDWDTDAIVRAVEEVSSVVEPSSAAAAVAVEDAQGSETVVSGLRRIPLRDVISQGPIGVPVRGRLCTHLDVFDAKSFVCFSQQRRVESARGLLKDAAVGSGAGNLCPFCKAFVRVEDLRVDQLVAGAMASASGGECRDGTQLWVEWERVGTEVCCRVVGAADGCAEPHPVETGEEDGEQATKRRRTESV